MRVRTETKRQQIIERAAAVFRETGYDRASMAQIAAQVGGSKTTLYGYFTSKQELFAAVMMDAMTAQAEALTSLIGAATGDPRAGLLAFGHAYLDLILTPDVIKLKRIGVAESDEAIGAKLYHAGPERGLARLADQLQEWIDLGLLRPAPARIAALHLTGLLEAGVIEPALFGVPPPISRTDAINHAVDVFLRAYAPDRYA